MKERTEIKSTVADLTIKRIPDSLIIKHIENTIGKTVSRMTLWHIKQRIKKESYDWYSKLREGECEYLHEFKERINEIVDVPYLTTTGLRRSQKQIERETQQEADNSQGQIRVSPAGHHTRMPLVENCQCFLNGINTDTVRHIECRYCLQVWCPKALGGQDWCPNPECSHGNKGV